MLVARLFAACWRLAKIAFPLLFGPPFIILLQNVRLRNGLPMKLLCVNKLFYLNRMAGSPGLAPRFSPVFLSVLALALSQAFPFAPGLDARAEKKACSRPCDAAFAPLSSRRGKWWVGHVAFSRRKEPWWRYHYALRMAAGLGAGPVMANNMIAPDGALKIAGGNGHETPLAPDVAGGFGGAEELRTEALLTPNDRERGAWEGGVAAGARRIVLAGNMNEMSGGKAVPLAGAVSLKPSGAAPSSSDFGPLSSSPAMGNERRSEPSPNLAAALAAKGFKPGSPIFMRIFKDSSKLEIWLGKQGRFQLYRSFDICRWAGGLGPKLYEGDNQSPEGFYLVDRKLFTRRSWKWRKSFSIGYPNAYDKVHDRTGSLILVHGGCTSSGCFAMTNPVIGEVYELARMAREKGQEKFHIHVFPFRMTEANLRRHKNSKWIDFWRNLKQGYDLFEKTGRPPRVMVCRKRYVFGEDGDGGKASVGGGAASLPVRERCYGLSDHVPGWRPAPRYARTRGRRYRSGRHLATRARRAGVHVRCNVSRPSCRRWIALRTSRKAAARRARARTGSARRRGQARARRKAARTKGKLARKGRARKKAMAIGRRVKGKKSRAVRKRRLGKKR
jgi:murein L,D-transpeptidase YafK